MLKDQRVRIKCVSSSRRVFVRKVRSAVGSHVFPQPESHVTRRSRSIAQVVSACAIKPMLSLPDVKSGSLRNLLWWQKLFALSRATTVAVGTLRCAGHCQPDIVDFFRTVHGPFHLPEIAPAKSYCCMWNPHKNSWNEPSVGS
jgi:hypothetical protein